MWRLEEQAWPAFSFPVGYRLRGLFIHCSGVGREFSESAEKAVMDCVLQVLVPTLCRLPWFQLHLNLGSLDYKILSGSDTSL